ncbi:hypothetical protein IT409_00830 [Candidatus Falkowbacteria bacterium]|nr:hypothetical protein [Candidatus Falkowbacteria bacterium]
MLVAGYSLSHGILMRHANPTLDEFLLWMACGVINLMFIWYLMVKDRRGLVYYIGPLRMLIAGALLVYISPFIALCALFLLLRYQRSQRYLTF